MRPHRGTYAMRRRQDGELDPPAEVALDHVRPHHPLGVRLEAFDDLAYHRNALTDDEARRALAAAPEIYDALRKAGPTLSGGTLYTAGPDGQIYRTLPL